MSMSNEDADLGSGDQSGGKPPPTCTTANWCWFNPLPQGVEIVGVWGSSAMSFRPSYVQSPSANNTSSEARRYETPLRADSARPAAGADTIGRANCRLRVA
jgi:hypothetical protein